MYPQHSSVFVWPSSALTIICLQYIQSTCATSGDGLYEGLNWLSENLRKRGAA